MLIEEIDAAFFRNGIHRFEAAMRGTPDRVPVTAQMHEFAMQQLGIPARDFYTTPELVTAGTLKVQQQFGIDVPVLDFDVYNVEAEALGQAIRFSDEHMPDVDRSQMLIATPADLDKIRTPDFENDGRFGTVIEMVRIFKRLIGAGNTTARICAPFSLAANIRGLEQIILDIHTDPDFARDLFARIVEKVLAPWVRYQKNVLPDLTSFAADDASGSLPIVSPGIIREWILPALLRLRQLSGQAVYTANWVGEHHLKKPAEMLDLKLQACPGFVEGQDPDVAAIGPDYYREYADQKGLPLILGVGAAFLALSTPQQVAERVREYITIGGKQGRFALYLCNLGATTPPENVRAAMDAVHRFGRYPEAQ